jgi:hypothetical protein
MEIPWFATTFLDKRSDKSERFLETEDMPRGSGSKMKEVKLKRE